MKRTNRQGEWWVNNDGENLHIVSQLVVVWGKKSLNFGFKTDFTNTRPKIN